MAMGELLIDMVQRELRQGHSNRAVAERLTHRGFPCTEQDVRRIKDDEYRPRGPQAFSFSRCKCHGWLVKGGRCLAGQLQGASAA